MCTCTHHMCVCVCNLSLSLDLYLYLYRSIYLCIERYIYIYIYMYRDICITASDIVRRHPPRSTSRASRHGGFYFVYNPCVTETLDMRDEGETVGSLP